MNFSFFDHSIPVKDQLNRNDIASFVNDRGFLFGDGFFTTGIIINGKLNYFDEHLQRLINSAERMDFSEFDPLTFTQLLNEYIKPVVSACIRVTVSRQQMNRGYSYFPNAGINVLIQLTPICNPPNSFCELFFAKTPATINPLFAGIKHLNRLDNVFAAKEIVGSQQESLLCNNNQVISGSRSNLFIKQDEIWLTPKIDKSGVKGITRQRILQAMVQNNIKYTESEITREQVKSCHAAFVTNSLIGIWIVNLIGGQSISTHPSEALKQLLNI